MHTSSALSFDERFDVCRYLGGVLHLCIRLTFLEALLYGAIISATDPVGLSAAAAALLLTQHGKVTMDGSPWLWIASVYLSTL